MISRLRARLADERGYTLMEMVTVMVVLGTVMAAVSTMLVAGTNAEVEMNRRFQAQTQARLALEVLRRDVRCAVSATPAGAAATVTLTVPSTCPTAAGQTAITWCTVSVGTQRYELRRFLGSSCSGTGRAWADYLVTQNAFSYTAPTTASKAKLGITLHTNVKPADTAATYRLEDAIVLRNSDRL